MRVNIKRAEETRGLIFKKKDFVVTVTVQFTEEEKKAIEMAQLEKYVLVERPPRAGVDGKGVEDVFHLRVRDLLKGTPDKYEFEQVEDADDYHRAPRDEPLPPTMQPLVVNDFNVRYGRKSEKAGDRFDPIPDFKPL